MKLGLEDAQFIFVRIFHTLICKFGWVDGVRRKKHIMRTQLKYQVLRYITLTDGVIKC